MPPPRETPRGGRWPSGLWLTHASVLRGADQRDPGRAGSHLQLRRQREGPTTLRSGAERRAHPPLTGDAAPSQPDTPLAAGSAWDADVVRTGIPYGAHGSEWTKDEVLPIISEVLGWRQKV